MSSLPSSEILQSLILHTLDRTTSIPDTRNLTLFRRSVVGVDDDDEGGKEVRVGSGTEDQIVLKSALESLEVREVRNPFIRLYEGELLAEEEGGVEVFFLFEIIDRRCIFFKDSMGS